MNNESQLLQFFKEEFKKNISKEEIYLSLLKRGHNVDEINKAYLKAKKFLNPLDSQKKTIERVVLIGALMIGAGIFSFVASNWQTFSKEFRLGMLLFFLFAFYFCAFLLEKKDYPKTARALYFVGTLAYGASIFLVGQMFNIRTNWIDAFVLWMIGAVLTAIIIDFSIVYYLGVLLGIIIVGSYFINHGYLLWLANSDYRFGIDPVQNVFVSGLLLLLAAGLSFAVALYLNKKMLNENYER